MISLKFGNWYRIHPPCWNSERP